MGENKQVRVDNWGMFFLQRLQLFFSKTDYCDLTLQFQGNVQLKVHRLVLNACTEYFEILEHSDRLIEENIILMPDMLQADVVVPIINFMYTGMLEYPMGIYHKLYQAADIMRLSILTKLLDAQRVSMTAGSKNDHHKFKKSVKTASNPIASSSPVQTKKSIQSKSSISELPTTLPGRKLPIWKRKNVQSPSSVSNFSRTSTSRHDSLHEAPKPTRFEWPDDDLELPSSDLMDVSDFGDISYTSKPLLREDEVKSMLDANKKNDKSKDDEMSDDEDTENGSGIKRKHESNFSPEKTPKKIKIIENENDTTIRVISNENSPKCDPTKIVSEILKKYPHLVKRNKNIKLKIISKPEKESIEKDKNSNKQESSKSLKFDSPKNDNENNVWQCRNCTESNGKPMEFILYYLYRKHMTDVHNVTFDPKICKYCGITFNKNELHSFHLFTKHGIKPAGNEIFPSCNQCPYVGVSKQALIIHKSKHKKSEVQCTICKLAFDTSEAIASHIQITGHSVRVKKQHYDCQYCMKTSQSPLSLLSHIKSNHETEARRDGIVSLDEIDCEENNIDDDDDDSQDEHTEEYVISEGSQPDKVKIISDVKVPGKTVSESEVVSLDQSKAVPTSIATNLGLLDIVVLDENQQFILQNPEENTEENRTEYILPPRNATGEDLASSTDELVMVLTDQDYKDGTSTIASDNSNIVVLYSHPADGQQRQFITSQGNLMVNSETGLLEIRNGTIASTSSDQIVVGGSGEHSSDHIETIEMIQREIDGNQETTTVNQLGESQNSGKIDENIESLEIEEKNDELSQADQDYPENKDGEERHEETNPEEPVKNELSEVGIAKENTTITSETEEISKSEENVDIQMNKENSSQETEITSNIDDKEENEATTESEVIEQNTENESILMETDQQENVAQNGTNVRENVPDDAEKPYSPTDNPIDMQCDIESNPDLNEKDADSINENSVEPENQDNDENSQDSEVHKQDVDIEEDNNDDTLKDSTKIAILDDWDDTDSQHSDNKIIKSVKKKEGARETVHKLMDDWEEDEKI